MHTDVVYEALHPLHLWAWIAAACAFALAAAAFAMFAYSQRFSRRWWLGAGILILCLLAVAFGARSRATAYDLRPSGRGCLTPGCGVDTPEVAAAQQSVEFLGTILLAATVLTLAAAARTLYLLRRSGAARRPPAKVLGIAPAILVAGCGAYWAADGITLWIKSAYLADITRAGDGLGQIPLIFAVVGTLSGVFVLAISTAAITACSVPRLASTGTAPSTGVRELP